MAVPVYFGSARQSRICAEETLPAKMDLIVDRLRLRERVAGETVAIKMHLGGNIGYSTIHPVFVRRVVKAVLDGGGRPFVTDHAGAVASAAQRGYTAETLGCPIYPVGGPDEKYFYEIERPYKNIRTWRLGGLVRDATFLIDLAHVKGHPTCGFGALIKNLALGCTMGPTRAALHDTMHFDPYWFPERCKGDAHRRRIMEACPFGAIVQDRQDERQLHLHFDNCNQCKRCVPVAEGALAIEARNFHAFQEANVIAVQILLETFAPGKAVFLSVATHMTPVCDCFGFTGQAILPDVGVFGSDDIVAAEFATLDLIGQSRLLADAVPPAMEIQPDQPHPFQQLHGPYKDPYVGPRLAAARGLGSPDYELIDVFPVEVRSRTSELHVGAASV